MRPRDSRRGRRLRGRNRWTWLHRQWLGGAVAVYEAAGIGSGGQWGPPPQTRPHDGFGGRRLCRCGCVEVRRGAKGYHLGRGHWMTAVLPAWTWRRKTAAWDVAVEVAARTTVEDVAAAAAVGGWKEDGGTPLRMRPWNGHGGRRLRGRSHAGRPWS